MTTVLSNREIYTSVVCGIVPILIVFFALQGYFVKGITAGAAKG